MLGAGTTVHFDVAFEVASAAIVDNSHLVHANGIANATRDLSVLAALDSHHRPPATECPKGVDLDVSFVDANC
jgi:hypothetical protein